MIPNWYEYGPLYLILAALRGDKNIVLVEFIDLNLGSKAWLIRTLYDLVVRIVIAPAMRRCVIGIQVMTKDEALSIAKRYRFDHARIHFIPWPLSGWESTTSPMEPEQQTEPYVFSSGRSACDWETLFEAAKDVDWKLRVVCSSKDLPRVQLLNANRSVEISSEITLAEHDAMLRRATVYALALVDKGKSAGQVRLGTCISLGIPVVATRIPGLDGYACPTSPL